MRIQVTISHKSTKNIYGNITEYRLFFIIYATHWVWQAEWRLQQHKSVRSALILNWLLAQVTFFRLQLLSVFVLYHRQAKPVSERALESSEVLLYRRLYRISFPADGNRFACNQKGICIPKINRALTINDEKRIGLQILMLNRRT